MPDGKYPDPREEDIVYDDRRISRPDVSLPDWHIPDASYRPLPIVWFATVVLIQIFVVPLLFVAFLDDSGAFTARNGMFFSAFLVLESALLGWWTWERGMEAAPKRWKVATILFLGGLLVLSATAALAG